MRSLYSSIATLFIVSLCHAVSITGLVRDSETGRPIAAATVAAPKVSRQTTSDRDGLFQLVVKDDKKVKITIEASGYYSRDYVVTDPSKPLSIALKPELADIPEEGIGLVIGVLNDSEIGTPVENADVFSAFATFTASDESGYFSLTGESNESIQVNLRHPDYRDTTISITFSDGRTATYQPIRWTPKVLRSTLAGSVSGTVLNEKAKPVPGVTVTVLNSDLVLQTDANGSYLFDTLYAGKHTLLATALGYEPKIFSVALSEREKLTQNISLQPKSLEDNDFATLKGKVFTPDADPVPGAVVMIDSLSKVVKSDGMGNYQFDSLPSGVFEVTAVADGFDITHVYDVDLWTGETMNSDIVLTVKKTDTFSFAKENGGVTGVVVSGADGSPVSGAKIRLIDQSSSRQFEAVTELDGSFIVEARKGIYTLNISGAGFKKNGSENVPVSEGEATKLDFIMEASDVNTMAKLTVRGVSVKSGNAALLKERQKSFEVVDAVGAEQFKKAGASDAADAMKAVTGVTIVNDKYVVIRGLPPKYSVVMLNNTVLPSADPDEQAVHMDMFPAGIIDNIMVYKTFQSPNPANFAGGIVNINTQPFPEEATWKASISGTYNTRTTFNDNFLTSETAFSEGFGFTGSHREIPDIIANTAKTDVEDHTKWVNGFSVDDNIAMGNEKSVNFVEEYSKSVSSEMTPITKSALPNLSMALSYGNSHLLNRGKLGYNLSLTYKNERKMKEGIIERSYGVNSPNEPLSLNKDFQVNDSKERVLWSFLGNGTYEPKEGIRLTLDYLFLKSGDNKVKNVEGMYPDSEYGDIPFYASRIHYIERTMNYIKAAGEQQLYTKRTTPTILWQGSFTNSKQDEPDMRDIYDFMDENGHHYYVSTMSEPSHSWRYVNSNMATGDLGLKIPFWQWSGDSATVSVGAAWQGLWLDQELKRVKYDIYNYYSRIILEGGAVGDHHMEYYINNDNMGTVPDANAVSGKKWGLTLKDNSRDVAQRAGTQQIAAQYAQLELPFSRKISATVGIRGKYAHLYDQTTVEEKQVDSMAAKLNDYDILPSAMMTAKPNDKFVVKGGYGKTLVRPTLREKAEYFTEAFTGGGAYTGNKDLQRSFIHNLDIRAEYFPKAGDLLAVGGFYKRVKNPIEETFLENDVVMPENSSSDADILGVEFEFIKGWKFGASEQFLELNSNLTLVYSQVKLDSSNRKLPNYFPEEDDTRPFQGQSPIVANIFLTYGIKKIGLTNSLYYNVFGKRLGALTAQDVPYLWEKPYHQLNYTLSKDLGEKVKLGFKVKNILDGFGMKKTLYYEFNDVEYIKHQSKKGIDFSLGLSFTF